MEAQETTGSNRLHRTRNATNTDMNREIGI